MKDPIVIIGSSGHAKVVIDIVEQQGRHQIAGLLDSRRGVGERTLGYPVLGDEPDLPELVEQHGLRGFLVAIGDNFVRARLAERVSARCPSLPLVPAVHPRRRSPPAPRSARAPWSWQGWWSTPAARWAASASSTPALRWTTTR